MLTSRSYYPLVSYGDALYAIAGWNNGASEHNKVERYTRSNGWTSLANTPYTNHR